MLQKIYYENKKNYKNDTMLLNQPRDTIWSILNKNYYDPNTV